MKEIKERTDIVLNIYRKYKMKNFSINFAHNLPTKVREKLQQYLLKNNKFKNLYNGNRHFPDESRCDMSLISYLKQISNDKEVIK